VVLGASALRLAAYWTLGPLLIWWAGSLGACTAALAATTAQAGYLGWRVRGEIPRALRAFVVAVALGGPLLGLGWLRAGLATSAGLFVAACLVYAGLLVAARVITRGEIASVWRALGLSRRGGRTP
jgi:hypothetical protein